MVNAGSAKDTLIDFMLEYDVPPENREEVLQYLKTICKIANIRMDKIVQESETRSIEDLERSLEREHQNVRQIFAGAFSASTSISSDPLLNQVQALVPTLGVLGQYKSDFEKEVVIFLRLLRLNAIKYQGQFADRPRKTHVVRFFENNPDILVMNGIESLIECKSSGEWKSPLKSAKSVPKELITYQQYFREVHSNSIVLAYEGSLDAESHQFIESILTDAKDIVFVTKNYLVNCANQPQLREKLVKTMKTPRNYPPNERVLSR